MRIPKPRSSATAYGHGAERAAWLFYLIAALGSSIGQVWVGVITPPWPDTIAWWWRALLVLPFAIVVDLAGVVSAAFADARRRLNEPAYGWRILSAMAITIGVGINVIGHHDVPYLAVVFGGLGSLAYATWLLHSGGRRRDALRAAGKLADTTPVYGIRQWRREPEVTSRAQTLALELGYSVHESLSLARQQLRDEKRQAALVSHVESLIRAQHDDPILASIAATTLDIDALSAELTARSDIAGWARVIGYDLRAPQLPDRVDPQPDIAGDAAGQPSDPAVPYVANVPVDVLRRVPAKQAEYDRWRELWALLAANPDGNTRRFADQHHISVRQVQWIRSVGITGMLDSPLPPAVRLVQMAQQNGHRPNDRPTVAQVHRQVGGLPE
jgi:hypothetical protein